MSFPLQRAGRAVFAGSLITAGLATAANAQNIGYGVTANGTLFRFNPASTATATTIGNLGILPEAIDFRPGTATLYAIDVGPVTTQLYTVNTGTGFITPVGAGFPTTVVGAGAYDLSGAQTFGFDFNPRTLQGDGSVRIRLVSSGTDANLRLNSNTGLVAAVDTALNPGSPFVDASAYTNSGQSTAGGATSLFGLDSIIDDLVLQNLPNDGTITSVGSFGVSIDANPNTAFDILSTNVADDTIADELAFAAFTRTATSGGAYLLYDVNLTTGETTNGRLVGGGLEFTGGLAVIPEPSTLAALGLVGMMSLKRRRRAQ
ncbi:MAG: DUF4394 domain-containing protein [Burkholderiales bacterium]|nr:DUF4394 domain-containing protein [Phycisphaerae bacterium]